MVRESLQRHENAMDATVRAWPVALLYGAQFLAIGLSMPLLPVWLAARGLGAEAIGQVLAAQGLARVLGQPLLARLADAGGRGGEDNDARLRRVMFLAAMLASMAALWLAGMAQGFTALLLGVALTFFFFSPLIPLTEVVAVRTGERLGIAYGRFRLWGSLTFTIGALLAGLLMDALPSGLLIWAVVLAMLATAASVLLQQVAKSAPQDALEDAASEASGKAGVGEERSDETNGLKKILTPWFILFLAVSGLVQASHAMLYGFSALHWQKLGHTGLTIGLLVTAGVLAEILLFWFSGQLLQRLGAGRLLMLGAAAAALRWLGMAFDPPLLVLFLLQLLHAFSFGAAHLGAITFIRTRTPARLAATAQAVHSSVSMGLFMMVAMWASGQLYEAHGAHAWLAMSIMAAVAVPLAAWLRRMVPAQA